MSRGPFPGGMESVMCIFVLMKRSKAHRHDMSHAPQQSVSSVVRHAVFVREDRRVV